MAMGVNRKVLLESDGLIINFSPKKGCLLERARRDLFRKGHNIGITSIIEEGEKISQHFNASGSSLLNENLILI